jgi:hypothetical protein
MKLTLPLPTLEQNILATLIYFDLFDYPLTFEELKRFLLGVVAPESSWQEILEKDSRIEQKENYIFLKGRSKLVEIRKERAEIAKTLWKKIDRFLPFIELIPFVRMVAVCNTLAFNNPTKGSDIDLFIITRKNRLFLARTLVTLLFSLLGVRRHGQKIAGRFCLSFYVSEEAMSLQKIRIDHDIYLLYWLLTLEPCYGENIYREFLKYNSWIDDFFDGQRKKELRLFKKNAFFSGLKKVQEWLLKGHLGDFIENKLFLWQQRRHQKTVKKLGPEASVIVDKTMLKFHNVDRREEFAERFWKRIMDL